MKTRHTLIAGAFMVGSLVIGTAYAHAQEVSPHAEAELQSWIARDPRLQADPGLMDNPTYLANHPGFAKWLHQHPNAHAQVQEMGDYDEHHAWHDRAWWKANHADWVHAHHPHWYD